MLLFFLAGGWDTVVLSFSFTDSSSSFFTRPLTAGVTGVSSGKYFYRMIFVIFLSLKKYNADC